MNFSSLKQSCFSNTHCVGSKRVNNEKHFELCRESKTKISCLVKQQEYESEQNKNLQFQKDNNLCCSKVFF